jgi:tripartite-type tricarboxylate transporter receptor subunit TctC
MRYAAAEVIKAPPEEIMRRLSRRSLLAGFLAIALLPPASHAGEQPLRLVLPYPAGGSADAILRMIGERLQESLRRVVIVENKTGAGGRIGAQAVKDGPVDGSTVLFGAAAQFTLQPHALTSLGYDPFADFIPISQTVAFDQASTVGPQIPAQSVAQLADWIKAHPHQATYGSPGAGTGAHFAAMEFGRVFGLPLVHVPYRGTAAAIPDLISGRIPMYIASSAELIALHKRGDVRIIATAGTVRSAFLPDVPTLKESGVDVDAPGWFGFFVKTGNPPAFVADLEKAILAATGQPEVRERMSALGFQPVGTSGKELSRIVRVQFDRWADVTRASGFKPE